MSIWCGKQRPVLSPGYANHQLSPPAAWSRSFCTVPLMFNLFCSPLRAHIRCGDHHRSSDNNLLSIPIPNLDDKPLASRTRTKQGGQRRAAITFQPSVKAREGIAKLGSRRLPYCAVAAKRQFLCGVGAMRCAKLTRLIFSRSCGQVNGHRPVKKASTVKRAMRIASALQTRF